MELHRNLKPWQPGQSGNPNGRPVGSRTASQGFHRDLAEVWADKGKEAILYTAEKHPAVFFATCYAVSERPAVKRSYHFPEARLAWKVRMF